MTKSNIDYFRDWEAGVFGYGYGTGEEPVLQSLRDFLLLCPLRESGSSVYDYQKLEDKLGKSTTWLLINILCKADIIEYGTSPRFGWLTKKGIALRKFMIEQTLDTILETFDEPEGYVHCFDNLCQCDSNCTKTNPFW